MRCYLIGASSSLMWGTDLAAVLLILYQDGEQLSTKRHILPENGHIFGEDVKFTIFGAITVYLLLFVESQSRHPGRVW